MSRLRLRPAAAALLGLAFGVLISWGRFADPRVIRRMLLLEDGYLWWMFMVTVSFVGTRLLRALRARALSDACPGPVAAQLGQGIVWSVFTTLGIGIGISLYLRRERRLARTLEPAPAAAR